MDKLAGSLLLAEESILRSFGENFRGPRAKIDAGDIVFGLLALVVLALGFWGLSRWLRRQEKHHVSSSPKGLFQELCLAHALDRAGRKALLALARQRRLEQPGRLFLDPTCFDDVENIPSLASVLLQLIALRAKLFDE